MKPEPKEEAKPEPKAEAAKAIALPKQAAERLAREYQTFLGTVNAMRLALDVPEEWGFDLQSMSFTPKG